MTDQDARTATIPGAIRDMRVRFLQTCDLTYRPLLEITSRTVREYCGLHGCDYESYFGIIRGYFPWHAAYNRIPLLDRMVQSGYDGWICYLDADAFVANLDFDLHAYFETKQNVAFVAAPGAMDAPWWNVNDGVFFINLSHPIGKQIVRAWSAGFSAITDPELRAAKEWSSVTDDQSLLWEVLQSIPDARQHVLLENTEPLMINYGGFFIKQVLRVEGGLQARANKLKKEVKTVLAKRSSEHDVNNDLFEVDILRHAFVESIYHVLLQRNPDPGGYEEAIMALKSGMSIDQVLRNYLTSSEFGEKFGSFTKLYSTST